MATINISLPDKLKKQADKLIEDGYYASFSDLVRTGLRQLLRESGAGKGFGKQTKLPKKLGKYFWDTEAGKIDLEKNDLYVIERVLDWGDTDDVAWLVKTYGKNLIAEAVKKRRGLSRKSAIFWADVLDINYREVACLQKPYLGKPFGL